MKQLIAILAIACAAQLALAGGIASTHSLASGTVAITNAQANSSWSPVAALFHYPALSSGTVELWRVSQGHPYQFASCPFTAASNLVWLADADIPFGKGDVWIARSSVTNGVAQLIRKGN